MTEATWFSLPCEISCPGQAKIPKEFFSQGRVASSALAVEVERKKLMRRTRMKVEGVFIVVFLNLFN